VQIKRPDALHRDRVPTNKRLLKNIRFNFARSVMQYTSRTSPMSDLCQCRNSALQCGLALVDHLVGVMSWDSANPVPYQNYAW
jgi:hypothetical protein